MASVDDIGIPGQPLGTPPLTAWQAAVRDRLNADSDALAWKPWTPTPIGATYSSIKAAYRKQGDLVDLQVTADVLTVTGALGFSLPYAAHADQSGSAVGVARCAVATTNYFLIAYLAPSEVYLGVHGASGLITAVSPTVPATWKAGNKVQFNVAYRSAG